MARILVVEDDPQIATLLSTMLDKLGLASLSVADGRSALVALSEESFTAALLDVKLPGIDGLEVARRIRDQGLDLAVVAVTAQALAGDRERCLNAGMNAYLAKPVTLEMLRATLVEVGVL